ncbi:hypothetical protein [Solimonas marina]|uniref:Uncharacterized protein n=1 Tax=Solimonas marina TaxID=2714601 RepID=A0A969W9S7_9GAMM|nr:hypothetical protein [Solimonas marina]NKF21541.1 hypothetical protein [Solimonas marina]
MGTKNNPAPCDCYAKAEPDEPLFVLLARDKHAPTLVWLWATLRELDGEKKEIVDEARQCALDMMVWAKDHNRKVVGLGQATLAGAMELVRTVNGLVKESRKTQTGNEATGFEMMRRFLAETHFEGIDEEKS